MNAPLDIDQGPLHHAKPARIELSFADIKLMSLEDEIKWLIRRYERLRDWQMQQARESERWEFAVSLRDQAKLSEQVVRDLSSLIR